MRIDMQLKSHDPALAPLRDAWRRAGARHRGRHAELAERARARHAALAGASLPAAVVEPLSRVPALADLVAQTHFDVEAGAREDFAGALAYFVDPDDLIPDEASRFGFLDDALVIRVALEESRHEWFAWCDYRDYVAAHPDESGIDRDTWMERRRARLEHELRRRRDEAKRASGGYAELGRYAPRASAGGRFGIR